MMQLPLNHEQTEKITIASLSSMILCIVKKQVKERGKTS